MKIVKSKHKYPGGSYAVIYHKEGDGCCYHREDGPAATYYRKDGNISSEYWYIDGKCHRESGPAITHYYKDGSVCRESWWIDGKELSKEQINNIKRNLAFNRWLEQELDHEDKK